MSVITQEWVKTKNREGELSFSPQTTFFCNGHIFLSYNFYSSPVVGGAGCCWVLVVDDG
jgi:hypothetical protein